MSGDRQAAIYEAVIKGNREKVAEHVRAVLDGGGDLTALLSETMIPAMREVGERFSRGEIYVPEMLVAARSMQTGLDILEPFLACGGYKAPARIAIGTVKGDLHDIGKNLVAIMLKGAGFEVEDLGVDCSVERYEEAANKGADVICLSALLTTTMPYMKTVVEHFKRHGDMKIVIGGAPVSREYARQIGADGYGSDATGAVHAVEKVLAD